MPIIVLLPTLGWAWPALVPILTAAAGYIGFKRFTTPVSMSRHKSKLTQQLMDKRIVTLSLDEYIEELVGDELGREEQMMFEKDGITIIFRKSVRGKFELQVIGPMTSYTRHLERIGREFVTSVIQQFAHSKVAKELEDRGINIVNEEVDEEGNIILQLRKWD